MKNYYLTQFKDINLLAYHVILAWIFIEECLEGTGKKPDSHKCIRAKIPESQIAVFVERNTYSVQVDLEFKNVKKDSLPDLTAGYVQTRTGDSGGTYWTYDTVNENDVRSIMIAIHSSSHPNDKISTDKASQCRMMATKITDDILEWIKQMSGMQKVI